MSNGKERNPRMLKQAAAGLVGLGLIGGAGTVIYDQSGDATVKIKEKSSGKVLSVRIGGAGGRTFSCPAGTRDKLEPHDVTLGRIKLTLQRVRRQERGIELQYPSHRAPGPVVDRFNALNHREGRLAAAYNAEVDRRNAILYRDCSG